MLTDGLFPSKKLYEHLPAMNLGRTQRLVELPLKAPANEGGSC